VRGSHVSQFMRSVGHGPGLGGCGFFGVRKLGAGDLQLVILALLAESPRHGYEIIKTLEMISNGFYAPSPGMVYPALTYLEKVGDASVESKGSKKLYRITGLGLARLEENRAFVDAVLAHLARLGRKLERVRQVFALDQSNTDVDVNPVAVDKAERELHAALTAKLNASPSVEELTRVAEVLQRATHELRGKK